jgi:DNA-binding NarL/FixJ family response regulator
MRKNADRIRVFLIDDHPVTRGGLMFLINRQDDMMVVAEASGCSEAMMKFQPRETDVVILDLSLGDGSGLDLISEILAKSPRKPILVFSMHDHLAMGPQAIIAGARGYIMKSDPPARLLEGIREVVQGELVVDECLQRVLLDKAYKPGEQTADDPRIASLSPRRLEVFRMLGWGLSARRIADQMSLSVKTVHAHLENIKKHLQLATRIQLLQQATLWVKKQNP